MAVADLQQDQYDFSSAEAKELVADHERSWQSFTRALVWGVAIVVVVLLGLLLFVA
jgi:Bacterial aa3 type cytochrome c oxidase subunit IV